MRDGHEASCPERRKPSTVDRRFVELAEWQRSDPDVALIISATLRGREVGTLGELIDKHPDVALELHEVAADLIDQAPPSSDPAFLRR